MAHCLKPGNLRFHPWDPHCTRTWMSPKLCSHKHCAWVFHEFLNFNETLLPIFFHSSLFFCPMQETFPHLGSQFSILFLNSFPEWNPRQTFPIHAGFPAFCSLIFKTVSLAISCLVSLPSLVENQLATFCVSVFL